MWFKSVSSSELRHACFEGINMKFECHSLLSSIAKLASYLAPLATLSQRKTMKAVIKTMIQYNILYQICGNPKSNLD